MDNQFIQDRIESTKNEIIAWEGAMTALGENGGVESYTIDTGQDRQTVTRSNLYHINRTIDSLYNRLATLEARLTGCGVYTGRPAW